LERCREKGVFLANRYFTLLVINILSKVRPDGENIRKMKGGKKRGNLEAT